jgi:hypothetical protein
MRRAALVLLMLALAALAGAAAYRRAHAPRDLPRWLEPDESYPKPDKGVG